MKAKAPSGSGLGDSPTHGGRAPPAPSRSAPAPPRPAGLSPAHRARPAAPGHRDTGGGTGAAASLSGGASPAAPSPPPGRREDEARCRHLGAVPVCARGRGAAAGGAGPVAERGPCLRGCHRRPACPHAGDARGCCQRSARISALAMSAALPWPAACSGRLHNEDLRDHRSRWPRLAPPPRPGAQPAQGPGGRAWTKGNPRLPRAAERSALI